MNMITVFNKKTYLLVTMYILGDFWGKLFAAFTNYHTISKTLTTLYIQKVCRATYVRMYILVSFSSLVHTLTVFYIILITHNYLSAAQASSSFKWLDMHKLMSNTPTLMTEALHLVT